MYTNYTAAPRFENLKMHIGKEFQFFCFCQLVLDYMLPIVRSQPTNIKQISTKYHINIYRLTRTQQTKLESSTYTTQTQPIMHHLYVSINLHPKKYNEIKKIQFKYTDKQPTIIWIWNGLW